MTERSEQNRKAVFSGFSIMRKMTSAIQRHQSITQSVHSSILSSARISLLRTMVNAAELDLQQYSDPLFGFNLIINSTVNIVEMTEEGAA